MADHLALPRAWSILAALSSPLRLTAESATTSGCAPFQTREVLDAGRTSFVHSPLVRVCSSQSQALPGSPAAQLISSRGPGSPLAMVSVGFLGCARPSQGEGGISAGC